MKSQYKNKILMKSQYKNKSQYNNKLNKKYNLVMIKYHN